MNGFKKLKSCTEEHEATGDVTTGEFPESEQERIDSTEVHEERTKRRKHMQDDVLSTCRLSRVGIELHWNMR